MRSIRPWVVIGGCLIAGLAALGAVAWHQGGFLRESSANYLRERLAAEFGVQFQTTDLRGTWFPPGLSLGRVILDRPGDPLVLTAEDVKIAFNPYAVLFGRERVGRVVIVRPRLFARRPARLTLRALAPPATVPSGGRPGRPDRGGRAAALLPAAAVPAARVRGCRRHDRGAGRRRRGCRRRRDQPLGPRLQRRRARGADGREPGDRARRATGRPGQGRCRRHDRGRPDHGARARCRGRGGHGDAAGIGGLRGRSRAQGRIDVAPRGNRGAGRPAGRRRRRRAFRGRYHGDLARAGAGRVAGRS